MSIYINLKSAEALITAMKIETYQIVAITEAMSKAGDNKKINAGYSQLINHLGRELRVFAYDFVFRCNWGMDDLPFYINRFYYFLDPLKILIADTLFDIHFGYFVREIDKIIAGLTNVLSNWIDDECE